MSMRIIFTLLLAVISGLGAEKLGKPLSVHKQMPIASLMAKPDAHVGQTVQVKGRVSEVCQMMGCWMMLVDGEASIRIKVKDGEIVFPKTSVGKMAVAEGKLVKIELTREQAIAAAKHEAEENGRKFDPTSITSAKTVYQIQGTGAELLD
jgi:hypothetical protein